jgi:hypothetical protein
MRYLTLLLLLALLWLLAAPAFAQPSAPSPPWCKPTETWTFDAAEKDSVGFQFKTRTLASVHSVTLVARIVAQADASPTSIATASSVSGDTLSITLVPDTGCGTAGCRAGNQYWIVAQPQDSAGNQPIGIGCLVVRPAL